MTHLAFPVKKRHWRMMALLGSYDVSKFAADTAAEIERLRAQVDLFWHQELPLYERLGMKDGQHILDCGCGPGHLLYKLKSRFPNLRCTGIDIDPDLISIASRNNQTDCRFFEQSACSIDLPDSTFDLVISRLVLEHLPNPSAAAMEIQRVLKPGGIAVIIDNDFDLHEQTFPPCPALRELYEAYRESRRADGGNPCIGRELPVLLRTTGYENVRLHTFAAHSELDGDEAFLRAEGSGIPAKLVKTGYLAPETLERVALEWMRMLETPGHAIVRILFAASGRKPLNGGHQTTAAVERVRTSGVSAFPKPGAEPLRIATVEEICEFMRNTLATEMDVPASSLSFTEPLIHSGVDSISALHLCNRLKTWVGISVPLAEILCGKSIEKLASEILALQPCQPGSPGFSISPQPRSGEM